MKIHGLQAYGPGACRGDGSVKLWSSRPVPCSMFYVHVETFHTCVDTIAVEPDGDGSVPSAAEQQTN